MFNDLHVHHLLKAKMTGKGLLKKMDRMGMQRMAVISPYMAETLESHKRSIDIVTKLCCEDPKRLLPLAWIEPTLPRAVQVVDYAVKKKIAGVKMIPNQWYPYEERLVPVFARIEEFRKPLMFHTGISWFHPDSSRFCRPVFFESLYRFPRLKFALAHISWPWTDECIATVQRMQALAGFRNHKRMQAYVEISRGTPPIYRTDALRKAIEILGPSRIIYASDSITSNFDRFSGKYIEIDRKLIVDELKFSKADFEQIAWKTFDDFFTPM